LKKLKNNKTKIDDQIITQILTVNGVRFSFEDGSWGLIRASSNKPSLVIVTESPTSILERKKFLILLIICSKKLAKVGEYDQKIY
jgi:phosphomannomutase/phosphoglucomutase